MRQLAFAAGVLWQALVELARVCRGKETVPRQTRQWMDAVDVCGPAREALNALHPGLFD
jgi:hypothetical protein